MIKEFGRVVAIEPDCLWVETIRQSTCNSCSAQKGCGHGMMNKVASGRLSHMRVLLRELDPTDFAVDDEVEIGIPEQILVTGALLVYLLPLVSMLAGAALVSQWWQSDVVAFCGAFSGFLTGFGLVRYHALRNRDNMDLQPVVLPKRYSRSSIAIQTVNPL
jgi:sigma-E factor negative regulatory protein RseC